MGCWPCPLWIVVTTAPGLLQLVQWSAVLPGVEALMNGMLQGTDSVELGLVLVVEESCCCLLLRVVD